MEIQTCCVVGHGPSLIGSNLGEEIDRHIVIRMKNPLSIPKEDAGERTDYVCSSTEVCTSMKWAKPIEFWAWPKKGAYDPGGCSKLEKLTGVPVIVTPGLEKKWNKVFRELRESDKYPWVSTGMAAIIIALSRLKPKKLLLAGFDTLLDPTIPYESTVSKKSYKNQIGHEWKTENKMLDVLSKSYGAEIIGIRRYLNDDGRSQTDPRTDGLKSGDTGGEI